MCFRLFILFLILSKFQRYLAFQSAFLSIFLKNIVEKCSILSIFFLKHRKKCSNFSYFAKTLNKVKDNQTIFLGDATMWRIADHGVVAVANLTTAMPKKSIGTWWWTIRTKGPYASWMIATAMWTCISTIVLFRVCKNEEIWCYLRKQDSESKSL